jgi:hypothetical protein
MENQGVYTLVKLNQLDPPLPHLPSINTFVHPLYFNPLYNFPIAPIRVDMNNDNINNDSINSDSINSDNVKDDEEMKEYKGYNILIDYWNNTKYMEYPDNTELKKLCEKTGFSKKTIRAWFHSRKARCISEYSGHKLKIEPAIVGEKKKIKFITSEYNHIPIVEKKLNSEQRNKLSMWLYKNDKGLWIDDRDMKIVISKLNITELQARNYISNKKKSISNSLELKRYDKTKINNYFNGSIRKKIQDDQKKKIRKMFIDQLNKELDDIDKLKTMKAGLLKELIDDNLIKDNEDSGSGSGSGNGSGDGDDDKEDMKLEIMDD